MTINVLNVLKRPQMSQERPINISKHLITSKNSEVVHNANLLNGSYQSQSLKIIQDKLDGVGPVDNRPSTD